MVYDNDKYITNLDHLEHMSRECDCSLVSSCSAHLMAWDITVHYSTCDRDVEMTLQIRHQQSLQAVPLVSHLQTRNEISPQSKQFQQ